MAAVSEKSLELNISAEILQLLRQQFPKMYLRGLTQAEESKEGVDVFTQLSPSSSVFAFQFKAPKNQKGVSACPFAGISQPPIFKYTLQYDQHDLLYSLSQIKRNSVYYVFPYYCCPQLLWLDSPVFLQRTWLLSVDNLATNSLFGSQRTITVNCRHNVATVNPEFELRPAEQLLQLTSDGGIGAGQFAEWYLGNRYLFLTRNVFGSRLTQGLRLCIDIQGLSESTHE